MASSSLNSEGQKKIRVMSLDYIKNSLTGKAPNKSVCGCNKDVDPNSDDQNTDIDSESVSGHLKSSVCKDCGRTKAKHKSGLFKFLSKRLWWKNNLSSESVNSNCTNEKVISDCNKCTFPSVLSDYNSSKDSNLNYNECVDKSYCDVTSSEIVGDDLRCDVENNETNKPSDNCLDLEASGKDSSECVAQINNGEFDTTAQTENINSDSSLESTSKNNIGLTVDVNNEGTVSDVDNSEVIPLPSPKTRSLTCELLKLSKYGWYWGPITREEAEEKLQDQPDGAFLVRDSSADHYLLSLSFRSSGKLLHTRIEHSQGLFSFYHQPEQEGFATIGELIDHSVSFSQSAVFCYSRPRSPGHPAFPVRLTKPVSRFTQVRSLQYLCRFVVRQHIRVDIIENLPLPKPIKGYIQEGHY